MEGDSMKDLLTKVTKLIDVKSIMTLFLTIAFIVLVFKGVVDGDSFETIFLMVVTFYFGTQAGKKKETE